MSLFVTPSWLTLVNSVEIKIKQASLFVGYLFQSALLTCKKWQYVSVVALSRKRTQNPCCQSLPDCNSSGLIPCQRPAYEQANAFPKIWKIIDRTFIGILYFWCAPPIVSCLSLGVLRTISFSCSSDSFTYCSSCVSHFAGLGIVNRIQSIIA